MPKSAPRRKRIRTARVEADPIAVPEEGGSNSNSANTSKADRKHTQKQSTTATSKKPTAGQERDKHLGPVLQKVRSCRCVCAALLVSQLTHLTCSASLTSSLQILQMIDYGQ
jgi:hypothetical protein